MQATLKLSLDRFAEMLRTHHEAIKNSNKNDRSVVRDPYKFVELFRDFWTQLKADAFLSGEVERLAGEHFRRMAEDQQRRGTPSSIPFIDITRETGCVFLRQTAGEYDDQEANDFRTACREWSADPSLSDEDRKWAADQANATTERRPLEEAVFAACRNSKVFPYLFESMLAALEWLVAVDANRPKTETPPGAPKGEGTPVDDETPPSASVAAGTTTLDARNGDEAVVTPKVYLSGWSDILEAVGLKNNDTDKNNVLSLNKQYQGPIPKVGRGEKPRVEKGKLLKWWNELEEKFQASDAARKDKAATVEAQYQHGRDETVVPEISGHEKKRRSMKN